MAQGRMFVASDVGGHRELIRHGETGFLCRSGSAEALAAGLLYVLGRRFDWPRVRQTARRFVEQERNWSNSVSRYAEVYRQALMGRGRPVPAALGT
jgi:glycosyltransferase involved in cell wall biosynthesis